MLASMEDYEDGVEEYYGGVNGLIWNGSHIQVFKS